MSILEPLFRDHHPEIGSELAGAYTNFSNRLTDAGRQDAALEATKQAVAVYRRIAEDTPDAYAPKLGEALANVALDLRNAGALVDALAAASEAVAIFRGLAARAPGIFDYGLSHALNSLALALADLERLDEALDAGREVVGLRRGLAARNPAFDEKLASALHNLSIDLRTAGREEEAQAVRAEVQAIVARTQDRRLASGASAAAEPREHGAAQEAPLVADPAPGQLTGVGQRAHGIGLVCSSSAACSAVSTSGAAAGDEVGAPDDHLGVAGERHPEREAGAGRCQITSASSRRSATSRRTTSRLGIRRSKAKRSSFSASSSGRRTNRAAVSSSRRLRCLAMPRR